MSSISPNMGLVIPAVGSDPGPAWAQDLDASLTSIDSHNHSPGQGIQIQPSGLNINSDLTFQSHNATNLNSSAYVNGGVSIPICGVYVSGGNLYYNNSAGTPVQITNGSSVNAGAGSITGLPSGTASVTYSSSTYVFQSATSVPANLDAGSIIVRNTTASANGVTISAYSGLPAGYNLILPSGNASSSGSLLTSDNSGNLSYSTVDGTTLQTSGGVLSVITSGLSGITGSQIASATITASNLASNAVNLGTSVITGTLPQSNGGTGQTSITATGTGTGTAATPAIASNSYTPGIGATSNITFSAFHLFQWLRVGNVVTASGIIDVHVTGANGICTITLPTSLTSNFSDETQCVGSCLGINQSAITGGGVNAATSTKNAQLFFGATTSGTISFAVHFTYTVS